MVYQPKQEDLVPWEPTGESSQEAVELAPSPEEIAAVGSQVVETTQAMNQLGERSVDEHAEIDRLSRELQGSPQSESTPAPTPEQMARANDIMDKAFGRGKYAQEAAPNTPRGENGEGIESAAEQDSRSISLEEKGDDVNTLEDYFLDNGAARNIKNVDDTWALEKKIETKHDITVGNTNSTAKRLGGFVAAASTVGSLGVGFLSGTAAAVGAATGGLGALAILGGGYLARRGYLAYKKNKALRAVENIRK